MDLHPTHLIAVRDRIADALDWVAIKLWSLAHWLRPVDDGPLCPDCRLGPGQPEGVECPTCRGSWEAQKQQEAIYGAGYEDGRDSLRRPDEWL